MKRTNKSKPPDSTWLVLSGEGWVQTWTGFAKDNGGVEYVRKPEWQPMETAPKDGTEILLKVERRAGASGCKLVGHYMPGGFCIEDHPAIEEGWYFWSGSMFDLASNPIEWMPLPD